MGGPVRTAGDASELPGYEWIIWPRLTGGGSDE